MRPLPPGRRFFVPIGVGRPGGDLRDLDRVPDDIVRLSRLFAARGYSVVSFAANLTAAELRAAFANWLERCSLGPADNVTVYFSGHGCVVDGDHYLCCKDFSKDAAAATGLRAQELAELALRRQRRPGKLWLIIDCCAAGGVLNDGFSRGLAESGSEVFVLAAAGAWSPTSDGSFSASFRDVLAHTGRAPSLDQLTGAINQRRPYPRSIAASFSWNRFDLLDATPAHLARARRRRPSTVGRKAA